MFSFPFLIIKKLKTQEKGLNSFKCSLELLSLHILPIVIQKSPQRSICLKLNLLKMKEGHKKPQVEVAEVDNHAI